MARITIAEAQGWAEPFKLNITSLDTNLLDQIEGEVLARLSPIFDTSTWTNDTNTPLTVRTIIAKMYVSWLYDRFYSENQDDLNDYAQRLQQNAETMIKGIIEGTEEVIDDDGSTVDPTTPRQPSFYPTDQSSSQKPTFDDPSLGGPYFSMGLPFT